MPFAERSKLELREEFVVQAVKDGANISRVPGAAHSRVCEDVGDYITEYQQLHPFQQKSPDICRGCPLKNNLPINHLTRVPPTAESARMWVITLPNINNYTPSNKKAPTSAGAVVSKIISLSIISPLWAHNSKPTR